MDSGVIITIRRIALILTGENRIFLEFPTSKSAVARHLQTVVASFAFCLC